MSNYNSFKNYELYKVKYVSTFIEFIEEIQKYGSKIAFREKNKEYSYLEFCSEIKCIISYMSQYENEIIAINIDDSRLFAVSFFAVVISGNIALLANNVELEDMDIKEDIFKLNDIDIECILQSKNSSDLQILDVDKNKVSVIACSSGTTSHKKGVMLSQKNLLSNMIAGMELYKYPFGATYVNILPYTHLFGIVADLMGPLYSGGTICTTMDKIHFFESLKFFKPTNLNLPPILVTAIYKMLYKTRDLEKSTGGKLKKILCAGGWFDDNVNDLFSEYGIRVYSAYGLTECSPCVTISRDDRWKNGSVGQVLSCSKVEIIDDEIVVSGDNVMKGYYNDPVSTNKVIRDNKLFTGDLGYIDEDGFLFLCGRKSNLIIFESGNKVLPESVENKINNLPGVKESLVGAVFKNNRTRLKIIVVIEQKLFEIEKLQRLLEDINLLGLVESIEIGNEELEKGSLGKIVRYKEYN